MDILGNYNFSAADAQEARLHEQIAEAQVREVQNSFPYDLDEIRYRQNRLINRRKKNMRQKYIFNNGQYVPIEGTAIVPVSEAYDNGMYPSAESRQSYIENLKQERRQQRIQPIGNSYNTPVESSIVHRPGAYKVMEIEQDLLEQAMRANNTRSRHRSMLQQLPMKVSIFS